MKPLTLDELNSTCKTIIDRCNPNYPELALFFSTLYQYGLRHIELYELSRWTVVSSKEIVIQTAKKGNTRIIDSRSIDPQLYAIVASGQSEWTLCRYNSMRYYAQHYSDYPFAVIGRKEVGMHIFRHTFIKNLYDSGWTIPDISVHIGEKDDKNTSIYVNSIIYPSF